MTELRLQQDDRDSPIVFFDGVCGLCNRFIDVLIRHDRKSRLRYAPLQGNKAQAVLPAGSFDAINPQTVVLWEHGVVRVRSDAILRLFVLLGGPWSILNVFRVVPTPLRDALYDFVARHRYAWFGHLDFCRLPSENEKALFFD